jgi:hypothetical protein
MDLTGPQKELCESYVITLLEATHPIQKGAADPELTLELLIRAAEQLKEHLQNELEELRAEETD